MTNQITIKDGIQELGIFAKNNNAWVSSRTLSKCFDKRHDSVIRSIEKILENPDSFTDHNFEVSKYKDKSGKKNNEYLVNRKSFTLVAMGFTGKKALEFKKTYIEAFEAMINHIETREMSKSGYKIMTGIIQEYIGNDPIMFSKEADMINKSILGMSAKDFRQVNDIKNTRDAVITDKLNLIDEAQRMNGRLIKSYLPFDQRKDIIQKSFK